MTEGGTNGLAGARSAYLRTAMHQPVDWNEWGAEAFAKAQEEDKPILLDIGAVWCHWCHVMDRESYENAETAEIINRFFVAVKVDRDERPDVDARYQAAAAAVSGQGGWPLTAFLTPEGKPYFAGTYFPPADAHGRPSFRRVLFTMAEAFQKQRGDVADSAESVMAAIEQNETFDGTGKDPGEELVGKIVDAALKQFDPKYGGFGSQPKFPHSGAVDLLLDQAGRSNGASLRAAMVTLEKMSKGGIYDHLAGGFHRYSVDERWVVPHFEKMSYDNSELLKNYVHAYRATGEQECARVAGEMIAWVDDSMSDRKVGGFYASQDADFSLDDDGDYFTWTQAEAAAVLIPEELAIVEPYFDIGPIGDMHHNFEKNTLHIEQTLGEVAKAARISLDDAAAWLGSAKHKMAAARKLRPTPYIDKTVYVGWNAMMVSAYLEAGRALGNPAVVAFGLKTLDRVLGVGRETSTGVTELGHVVAYGDGAGNGEPVAGVLEDYVFTGVAALDAWEATGQIRYFEAALKLGRAAIEKFYDDAKGGFFDTERTAGGDLRLGALSTRRKPLQDSPSAGGNPVAAALLVRLADLSGDAAMRARAKATLECFAGVVEHFGLHCASYGLALRRMTLPPLQVVVVGPDAIADALESVALQGYEVNKSVVRLRAVGALPPALAETISLLPVQEGSFAVVCSGFTCRQPVRSAEELQQQLRDQD